MSALSVGYEVVYISPQGVEEIARVLETHPNAMGAGKPAIDLELENGEVVRCITKIGVRNPSPQGSWRHLKMRDVGGGDEE